MTTDLALSARDCLAVLPVLLFVVTGHILRGVLEIVFRFFESTIVDAARVLAAVLQALLQQRALSARTYVRTQVRTCLGGGGGGGGRGIDTAFIWL